MAEKHSYKSGPQHKPTTETNVICWKKQGRRENLHILPDQPDVHKQWPHRELALFGNGPITEFYENLEKSGIEC
jgi:hypothetical protein